MICNMIYPKSRFSFLHLPDGIHTLTCALMLLNTDLHGHVSTALRKADIPPPTSHFSQMAAAGKAGVGLGVHPLRAGASRDRRQF